MSRRRAPLQVNQFTGGLNTDTSPLNAPLEISVDEINMDIELDGSRRRRDGFNYEGDAVTINSGTVYQSDEILGYSTFRWANAGGDPSKVLLVVQIGNNLRVFDLDETPLSNSSIYTRTYSINLYPNSFAYAVVDGLLVVATGAKEIYVYEYDGSSIVESETTLKIRDLFGVEAYANTVELTNPSNVEVRPMTLSDEHLYNLRNQTFARARIIGNTEAKGDPVNAFFTEASVYPSNADAVNYALYPDSSDTDNRLVERFFANNLEDNPPGSFEAPSGYFIIDALERGTSRLENEVALRAMDSALVKIVTDLPLDRTPGGATVITEHAGRVWYGGFSGVVEGGDSKSPRMSSYVLFSSLVIDKSGIGNCYQLADPTSHVDSSVVDTDGGFIRIDGAYGIKELRSIDGSLLIFAENGVWKIDGEGGFSAVSYSVDKIINRGCIAPNSIVIVENTIMFWSEDAIYHISRNQYGVWEHEDMVKGKIKNFFIDIPRVDKNQAFGYHDVFTNRVHWVYNSVDEERTDNKELIFDLNYGAFIPRSVNVVDDGLPTIVGIVQGQPYRPDDQSFLVTVGGEVVTVGGEDVTITSGFRGDVSKLPVYVVISETLPTIEFSFGQYNSMDKLDWGEVDSPAYLITGDFTAGEPRSRKQVPYLTTFFKKTEQSFDEEFNPENQSSCFVSGRWGWDNTASGSKWTLPRQAYRNFRTYFPTSSSEAYDDGQSMIITKNKIRGFGKAVAFKFESEAGMDMHLYGWSFMLTASSEE